MIITIFKGSDPFNFCGKTTDEAMANFESDKPYYGDILSKLGTDTLTGRITNMYNEKDAALKGWELNQLTKPDSSGWGAYEYSNEAIEAYESYLQCLALSNVDDTPCSKPDEPLTVTSKFYFEKMFSANQLHWSEVVTEDSAKILAHIVPARTKALGQTDGVSNFESENSYFTDSNQDHSAQFHGYYAEESAKNGVPTRAKYWNYLLDNTMLLENYSGLKNTLGLD